MRLERTSCADAMAHTAISRSRGAIFPSHAPARPCASSHARKRAASHMLSSSRASKLRTTPRAHTGHGRAHTGHGRTNTGHGHAAASPLLVSLFMHQDGSGEPGTWGRWRPVALALDAVVAKVGEPIAEVVRRPRRERKAQIALLVQPHAHLGRACAASGAERRGTP